MTSLTTLVIGLVIKSSIILICTFAATLIVRRQSASLRHMIWTAGLLSTLALPLFGVVMPAWYLEPIRVTQPSARVVAPQSVTPEATHAVVLPSPAAPRTSTSVTPQRALFYAWLVGVLSIACLLLREAIRLTRVSLGARAVDQSLWRNLARDVSRALQLKRRVRLMRNPRASVLGTWGALRPRVLLPRESESWSGERIQVVLGHELAHVKRNDWLVQVIAESARAIYWFNPLFWLACSQLRRESEHACDDAALCLGANLGFDGPTYAGHVLELARSLKHCGQPGSVALAMASSSNLERRLIAMLNPSLNRRVATYGTIAVIVLLALGLTLPLAAVQSGAPMPVSVIRTVEITPPIPTAAVPAVTETPAVVQRPMPRAVAMAVPSSPAIHVEAVQAAVTQTPTGTLSGVISDPTGAVIPGVSIIMTAKSDGTVRRTISNESGNFAFFQLSPDNYFVTANLPGFKQSLLLYVLTDSGSNARFNIPLQIAPTFTDVNISVQAPPGLKCFSVFGAFKADGTPFTEADCPGGTIVTGLPARASTPAAVEPNAPTGTVVVIPFPVTPVQPVASANGRRDPIRVGGNIQAGRLLSHANPPYPTEARNRGVQGAVVLSAMVGEDGRVRSLKIISSANPLLETSVLETIQNWTYSPTLLNREPVEVLTTITLNFTLEH